MAKKQYFLLIDTETTMCGHVADFGAIVTDKKGNIHKKIGVLISDYFYNETLFHNDESGEIWKKSRLKTRYDNYAGMVENGQRIVKSVTALNNWLELVWYRYQPELTAYNLAFDVDKCKKSGIDLDLFINRFCLWHLAAFKYAKTYKYLNFVLQNHYFRPVTTLNNMTYITNAEVMAHFITGKYSEEPHTSLEDCEGYELPILLKIINTKKWREKIKKYDWQNFQVKNHFKPFTGNVRLTDDKLTEG